MDHRAGVYQNQAKTFESEAASTHLRSMKAFNICFALTLLQGFAAAQHFDFGWGLGVKGGIPTTDLLKSNFGSTATLHQQDNYLIGPVGELRIPFGFALEVDGLYRGTNYVVTNTSTGTASIDSSSWEVPYLAKFRFPIPLLKPFLAGGGAYRTFNGLPAGMSPRRTMPLSGLGGLSCESAELDSRSRDDIYDGARRRRTISRGSKRDQAEILFGFYL